MIKANEELRNQIIDNYKKLFTEKALLNFIDQSRKQGLDPKFCLISDAALRLIFPFYESGDLVFNGITFQPSKLAEFATIRFSLERFDLKYDNLDLQFND